MKSFIAIVSLFTLITAQAATISAKALLGIESRIETQREALNDKLDSFTTEDMTEGRLVAAMTNLIQDKLEEAEDMLNSINSDEELTEEKVAEINKILNEVERLIQEI